MKKMIEYVKNHKVEVIAVAVTTGATAAVAYMWGAIDMAKVMTPLMHDVLTMAYENAAVDAVAAAAEEVI